MIKEMTDPNLHVTQYNCRCCRDFLLIVRVIFLSLLQIVNLIDKFFCLYDSIDHEEGGTKDIHVIHFQTVR